MPHIALRTSFLLLFAVQSPIMSNSLQPHELPHARLPCPSLPHGICSNSHPLSQGCHPAISFSVTPFSFYPQSFASSGSFPISRLCITWPKNWNFSFSISPCNEYSRLISFRFDCFDFLAVQGTLKSLLQPHSSKASILQCSAFLMVQLSHLCMTTGKTIALTIWSFVSKVMSLFFNMLSKFVIAFLSRSQHLLILSLEHKMVKIVTPSDLHILVKII